MRRVLPPAEKEIHSLGGRFYNPTIVSAPRCIAMATIVVPVLLYMLSFAAGAMFYMLVEKHIPEMSNGHRTNISTIGLVLMKVMNPFISL